MAQKRKTNRQRADLTQRGSRAGFSSSQQVRKVSGVQPSGTSAAPRAVAQFGGIPGMPVNAQAPQMDQSTAQIFSSLSDTFTDMKKTKDYFAAREIATNDEISRNDTQLQADEHYNSLKVGFEEELQSGNFVFGANSGTPLKTAMEAYLDDDSALWHTPDFRSLPQENKEKIKRDIRSSFRKDAMAYEIGTRIESNKNRIQKASEINSIAISGMAPQVDPESGRLISPDGKGAFPRQEWAIKEIANNAHTPGLAFSNINRAFENDFQAMILSSEDPSELVFNALLEEYKTLDGRSLLVPKIVKDAREDLKEQLEISPQATVDNVKTAILTFDKNKAPIGPETLGSGSAYTDAATSFGYHKNLANAKAAMGDSLTPSEKSAFRQSALNLDAIKKVNEVMALNDRSSRAYMKAAGWPMTQEFTHNDLISKLVTNIQVALDNPATTQEERDTKDSLQIQLAIAQAAQSKERNEVNWRRSLSPKHRAAIESKTITGIQVTKIYENLYASGMTAITSKDAYPVLVEAFSEFYHEQDGRSKLNEKGITTSQVALGSLIDSAMENDDIEAAIQVYYGTKVSGLNENEVVAPKEFHSNTQSTVLRSLGGQAVKNATAALDALEDLAYANLFKDETFAGKVSSYEVLKAIGSSDREKKETKAMNDFRTDIARKVENTALGYVGRSKLRANGKSYYPKKSDVENFSPRYMSAFIQNSRHLAGGIFVANDIRSVRQAISSSVRHGYGGSILEEIATKQSLGTERYSKEDVAELTAAIQNSSWDHEVLKDNLVRRMTEASEGGTDPVRAYDSFMLDLALNSELIVAANGNWHMQSNSEGSGKNAMVSLPGSFQSLQARVDDRFMEAVEATAEAADQNEGWWQELWQTQVGDSLIMQGYVSPAKETFQGSANDHIKENLLKAGSIDWKSAEIVGAEGTARRYNDGNFSAVRLESSMKDYWDKTKGSRINRRNHASSPYEGSDEAHNITRSFAPMFDSVMPQLLDVNHNLSRSSSEFNRHMQEQIEAPKRKEIELWMDKNSRTDLNVSMTVGTFSEDTAAFNEDVWDKGSVKPSIMALSALVEITDPEGNVIKTFEWDVRDEYALSIFERSNTK